MNRRQFFRSIGIAGVAVAVAPAVSAEQVAEFFAPPHRGLTIAQIIAVSYPQILSAQQRTAMLWGESAFLRECDRQGILQAIPLGVVELSHV